ncbi:hypothetical protein C9994_06680 [Marivirga lumbricoides]|uniref:Uncharacterized protein n=1 Tax=Marivirga lumbricoides TaxID=1046115 RepID=A0A2T4DRY3_9BACT|nr:hypothetical protein C9994_06680 [Marivirga lumbricoides]
MVEITSNDIKVDGSSIFDSSSFIFEQGLDATEFFLAVSRLEFRLSPKARVTNISLEGYGENRTTFPGVCSCSDDAELIEVIKYNITEDPTEYVYQLGWKELPCGYSTVQLGYRTNNGTDIVVSDDFLPCENGGGWFIAPPINQPNGPSLFWIKAGNAGIFRGCNNWVNNFVQEPIDFSKRRLK